MIANFFFFHSFQILYNFTTNQADMIYISLSEGKITHFHKSVTIFKREFAKKFSTGLYIDEYQLNKPIQLI